MNEMREDLYEEEGGLKHCLRYRFNDSPITIIFLHGIGDSGDNYLGLLNHEALQQFNVVVSDFLGYGKSVCSPEYMDYSFEQNLAVLEQHLQRLQRVGIKLNNIVLVGHSMGADIATLLCSRKSLLQEAVIGFVNTEGSLTEHDTFVSKPAFESSEANNFSEWFKRYKTEIAPGFRHSGSYLHALELCNPKAFEQNARELYARGKQVSKAGMADGFSHSAGELYARLTLPKLYLYGETVDLKTQDFISRNERSLKPMLLATDSHWVMFSKDFMECLVRFIGSIEARHEEGSEATCSPRGQARA
jgi:pimeloyl-ACP methyl ester carboxylesterase